MRSCCTRMWSGSEALKLINITSYLFSCHLMQVFFWQINQGGKLVHDSLNIMLRTRRAGADRWRQDFRHGGSSSLCNNLEVTEACFEVQSRFCVQHLTEGSDSAEPSVFGVGLTVATFLPTPSPRTSGLSVLPGHPYSCSRLIPTSGFCSLTQTGCGGPWVGRQAWGVQQLEPCSTSCLISGFWLMWPWRPAYRREKLL